MIGGEDEPLFAASVLDWPQKKTILAAQLKPD
jgi:hypothetical protein